MKLSSHAAPLLVVLASLFAATPACQTASSSTPPGPAVVVDLAVAQPPYKTVEANWKHRMGQPYVYMELRGDYRDTGRAFAKLASEMKAQGMRPSGAPFPKQEKYSFAAPSAEAVELSPPPPSFSSP